ncbi:SusC/RagA family TonB-linked outer membrane protein [Chitinophaga sp. SYP-B3965]|uniref:TonB-dependent receptor n=1 Tax=Chitinophaga sp. SYP-B3965 TaxID=2663120 RepID=UPI001299A2A6|nr:TonB-dependent receptor [Chitinophaga sp. SYP-B3965]MRG45270.1 SusC/RagA family TonB-linked outer membrane protein [Chitinophaga sp. SYP-B3965]
MQKISTAMSSRVSRARSRLFSVIRMSFFLHLIAFMQVSASSVAQKISLNKTNASLLETIKEIRTQSGYSVLYDEDQLQSAKKVTIHVKDVSLTEALNECFKGQPFSFIIRDRTVLIVAKATKSADAPVEIQVSGTITDNKGEALPGVNIYEKGSNNAVSSGNDGKYSIALSGNNAVLVFRFIGFENKEVRVMESTVLNIILQPKNTGLNEVLVIGYGSQKKSDITGALVSVNSKTIAESPVVSVAQALKGRVAGMDIVNSSGRPGASTSIRIRGNRSITAGNEPLYVLDGIPMAGDINGVNPGDVESVQVLKDASATAIYGSRGANGVILITTKTGKTGKAILSYDGYYGITDRIGDIEMMNTKTFSDFKASFNGPVYPGETAALQNNLSTNYEGFIFKKGNAKSHTVSVRGGTDKTKYSISSNYYNEEGIVQKGDFTRYNIRVNLDQQINDKIKIGTNSFYTYGEQNYGIISSAAYLAAALQLFPGTSPYKADGSVNPQPDGSRHNPLAEINSPVSDLRKTYRFFGSLYGEYKIMDGLSYRLNLGLDNSNTNNGSYNSSLSNNNGLATAGTNSTYDVNYTIENILKYTKTFGKSSIDATGLFSLQKDIYQSSNLSASGIPYDSQLFYNLGTGNATGYGSNYSSWSILSYMGRINYGYDDKYLATVTMRADGSSRLAPGSKWGYFPSVALAWRVSEEGFMKGQEVVSDLKLRASYGVTGNTGISPYATQGGLTKTVYSWDAATPAYGYRPGALANAGLKWESTASTNIGLDFALWGNRISGAVEFYHQNTYNLLLARAIPSYTGFSSFLQNIGKTRNKGLEITLSAIPVKRDKGLQWNVETYFDINREAIVALTSGQQQDIGNGWFVGQPINIFFDYKMTGVWQTHEAPAAAVYGAVPGDLKILDPANNGKTDAIDRVIIGTPRPKWTAGLTNRFAYKGVDLSIFVYFRQGQTIYSDASKSLSFYTSAYGMLNLPYWSATNPTNAGPRGTTGGINYLGALYYNDGSYISIPNITLGYTIPDALANTRIFSSLRAYVTAQNCFAWMNHPIPGLKGISPEIPAQNGYLTLENAIANRVISFGISASF